MSEAWVTLATNDRYALGALVLARSLRRVGTTRRIAVMITSHVSDDIRRALTTVFDDVTEVALLDSKDEVNLKLIQRPDLGATFTKLHCWRLNQFSKCVFLDADTLVISNCDELFDREELTAAPDVGWPDLFNSGVFVFRPSIETYKSLLEFAVTHGSFDGGDQGLLNAFFSDWYQKPPEFRLPFIYNMVFGIIYTYAAAFKRFGERVKIVHFLGSVKPWDEQTYAMGQQPWLQNEFWGLWWRLFADYVYPYLPQEKQEELHLPPPNVIVSATSAAQMEQTTTRDSWERGEIDYLGLDSFANIQRRLQESIGADTPK